jgi:hypothetical protein
MQTRGNRRVLLDEVSTGNDHTAGQSLARLEDLAWRHEQRLDGLDLLARETREMLEERIADTNVLIADFVALQPGLHALIDPPEVP